MEWRADDPLTEIAQDTLGMKHVAQAAAELIQKTHSFGSSTVVGLSGPWGSGKSSVLAMCLQKLQEHHPEWAVGAFTPWATNDSAGMMTDFYATLTGALPGQHTKHLRRAIGVLARVGAPALKVIPYAGDAAAEVSKQAAEGLLRQPSWDRAFQEVSTRLTKLQTPVLIVVDDVDRLQPTELLTLLKVIRLLGRFPGVSYLLAYDEQTITANLGLAGVGAGSREGARLFMEKIVQHPLAIPPMLESQVLQRVGDGLDEVLAALGRSALESESRLNMVTDALVAQLRTPRAVKRYLAQVRLTLSMHDAEEINDVDVILVTLVRVQFPDLYAQLQRWKEELTGGRSDRRVMSELGHKKPKEVDFGPLFEAVPDGPTREDAREVMAQLFPVSAKTQVSSKARRRISDWDYFDRYLVHTVPNGEVPDTALRAALREAGTEEAGVDRLRGLLTDRTPAEVSVAIRRARSVFESNPDDTVNTLQLLGGLLEVLDDAPEANTLFIDAPRRLEGWASHLVMELSATVTADALEHALRRCTTPDGALAVLWDTRQQGHTSNVIRVVAERYADRCLSDLTDHLRQGDDAPLETPCHFQLRFILAFGDCHRAKDQIARLVQDGVPTETLASRCVSVGHIVGIASPQGNLRRFDQETFAHFGPDEDPLYKTAEVADLDTHDLSWANRRAYVRGRVAAPPMTPAPDNY